ncbi:MAG: alkaline phosphatase family protein [Actinomycetota bacterium]|nr:alkaline phosphatase family protein [Actinomycetota bacterium]
MRAPDYQGGGLVNLVAELEQRLTGSSAWLGLEDRRARLIPPADSFVLFLFDGLGDHQLVHPAAVGLAACKQACLDSPFPSTTTVSLASVSTGLPPSRHGLLGYQLWMPELQMVVNTLKWSTLWGDPVAYEFEDMLPSPNLWERLTASGIEAITVQPGDFSDSPLTRTLYRGARFEPAYTMEEMVGATVALASRAGRLVMAYLPHVDVAAHTKGQGSREYLDALRLVGEVWDRVTSRLPNGVVAIGTSDHGHLDVPRELQVDIPRWAEGVLTFYGDPRVTFARGEVEAAVNLAEQLPATWMPLEAMLDWWGPSPRHPRFDERAPAGALVADPGHTLLHRHSDRRLVGAHGGLMDEELSVPLLIAP